MNKYTLDEKVTIVKMAELFMEKEGGPLAFGLAAGIPALGRGTNKKWTPGRSALIGGSVGGISAIPAASIMKLLGGKAWPAAIAGGALVGGGIGLGGHLIGSLIRPKRKKQPEYSPADRI